MFDELAEREQEDNVLRPVIRLFSSPTDTFDELGVILWLFSNYLC